MVRLQALDFSNADSILSIFDCDFSDAGQGVHDVAGDSVVRGSRMWAARRDGGDIGNAAFESTTLTLFPWRHGVLRGLEMPPCLLCRGQMWRVASRAPPPVGKGRRHWFSSPCPPMPRVAAAGSPI